MARRRRRDETAVSLFPFLSVLACVIGTLTLLLSAMAVGHMGGASVEQIWLAERLQTAKMSLAGGKARLLEIEAQLEKRAEQAQRQDELGRRLEGLGLDREISLEELERLVSLQEEAADLKEQQGLLEGQVIRLAATAKSKAAEIEKKEALQAGAPIIIDPSGMSRDQIPYLVLCTAEYVELFHRYGDTAGRYPSDQLEFDRDFKRFLRRVRNISDAIVIFMIRPDGVETHTQASRIADQLNVRNAKLPLPGTGEIDFSMLREKSR
ncbi:MAG: hypothetical protein CL917_09575 [Deltaproteobacteria bacterium]|nr:hypothetical protein [Deltaproteobacteria bacterium]